MVSLLDNGSCFRKVAPNTRSSEKSRITGRDHVSGCIGGRATRRAKGSIAVLFTAGVITSWTGAPVCHPAFPCPGTSPHLCGSPTSPPRGAHGISACAAAIRLCGNGSGRAPGEDVRSGASVGAGDGVARLVARHLRLRARHAGPASMYEPIPTSSGWIAAAAQKLWSPGSRGPWSSPMLGAASWGARGPARLLSLL